MYTRVSERMPQTIYHYIDDHIQKCICNDKISGIISFVKKSTRLNIKLN